MEMLISLLKDVWFSAALVTLVVGVFILFWCLWQLRNAAPSPSPALRRPSLGPGAQPPLAPRQMPSASNAPPRSQAPGPGNDAAVLYGVLEERFADLSKRIATLESVAGSASGQQANMDPFLKRLDDMQKEINNIKNYLANAPAPAAGGGGGSVDLTALTNKVATLQKMIESLALESEAPRPS